MKKKIVTMFMAVLVVTFGFAGCANTNVQDETQIVAVNENTENVEENNQEAADRVADLIDAIYVQERTDETDRLCEEAKAAWDNLTDMQKELVNGKNADPDYFGKDTGDASLDNPRNQDEIGEKEILVVSFGTSYNDSRVADIKGIEDAIEEAFPEWSVRRAFTSQIIINHVQARDGEKMDNVTQALDRAVANGVKKLLIQPTHLMHGAEYDELIEAVDAYRDQFEQVMIAQPLLGEAGADATVINEDKEAVAQIVTAESVRDAGYESLEFAAEEKVAFVFMGHGTSHTAKVTYSQMKTQMSELGYENVFIGTVEGEPEDTSCESVIEEIASAGYTKVILRPFMVVAGDHANNDMAGDEEDSWVSMFRASGMFESVETQITGLGTVREIQQIYVSHVKEAMHDVKATALEDGVYTAEFTTDSSMFHVNEACEGKGTLKVENGEMTIHISLASKNIVNLYPGLAADAERDSDGVLQPTIDTVTYRDGLSEEVNGFDVPVAELNTEFDLALLGKKGVWYDHRVMVSNPEKIGEEETEDGIYTIELTFEGGSGKAQILSPATITVKGEEVIATIQWNSPNYDYMVVDGEKYLPVNTEGDSVFEIPVSAFDEEIHVIGDTVAMSKPHEVEYTLNFHADTMKKAE